jgi:hypothetical protein
MLCVFLNRLLLFIYRPNLLDSHMALMLLTFIDAGFIEVIFLSERISFCSYVKYKINLIVIY